jgi:hypothetical protein
VFDGRNLLDRHNILALSRATGRLSPPGAEVLALARSRTSPGPIPAESPLYTTLLDLDRNGVIDGAEFDTGRIAAAIDRFDPSLYFGEARQLRLGIEVSF